MGGKSSKHKSSHPRAHGSHSRIHGSLSRIYEQASSRGTARYSTNSGNYVQPDVSRVQKKYSKIGDDYHTLSQVTEALAQAGLESSNLIVGIDFTKSNEWTGKLSFNRRSLHSIGVVQNPYQQAISIIGRTLSAFDEDNLIPCFGFGDASTHDHDVFRFYSDNKPCHGFEDVLHRYGEIVPHLRLAGPTSFAPIIETAIGIVDSTGGQYHVLLIVADGQVTRSVDTQSGQLSQQERDTVNAIVKASDYPLSIVMVGVGDGPWDMMRKFDDNIPSRVFDNFQFVNFTEIMSRNFPESRKEAEFALSALMEIPAQYKATIDLQLLGQRRGTIIRASLPPPVRNADYVFSNHPYSTSNTFSFAASPSTTTAPYQSEHLLEDKLLCPICLCQTKDLAFGCGHQACHTCGEKLQTCPFCLRVISTRLRLY